MLGKLGINLFNVTNETAPSIMQQSKFCYLFAPVFHPMMRSLAPLRKELGIPTIFNILGPLLNPAPLRARIIGVYAQQLGLVFAKAVLQLNIMSNMPNSRALIVWGEEGLDEISPAGKTRVWELRNQQITEYTISSNDFGLPTHALKDVASGTPEENAQIVLKLVNNELPPNHPILDYVLLNTAALAVIDGVAKDWKHGVELARESIISGRAKQALETFVKLTQ
jgi:anthranilate phosphoribosyltransferase